MARTAQPYRALTEREVDVLRGLPHSLLPAYIRTLHKGRVRYRDIAEALDVAESTVASWAARGRAPVIGQEMPASFAKLLRSLRERQDPELNEVLAVAVDQGWSCVTLATALGISPQAAHQRTLAGRSGTGGKRVVRKDVPSPTF